MKTAFFNKIWITAFAMFSIFFGAGNFILPPYLGSVAKDSWWIVSLAFCVSAVCIPLLGVFVQAKLQGTVIDFGKKVHPKIALFLGILIYAMCITFPVPRTASVTYEIGVLPLLQVFEISNTFSILLIFNVLYFSMVFYLCYNRNTVLNVLGKYLTPTMLIIIMLMIGIAIFSTNEIPPTHLQNPFAKGLLEGYQTFDAMSAIIISGVITFLLSSDKSLNSHQIRRITVFSGILSGLMLFTIYTGFIYSGALFSNEFTEMSTRTEVLSGVTQRLLGNYGKIFLGIAVSLSCFTTAVGITMGGADFLRQVFKGEERMYRIIIGIICIGSCILGLMGVDFIIKIAEPTLVLFYPMTIMLIFLNLCPEKYATTLIFRVVSAVALLSSIPDALAIIGIETGSLSLPLEEYKLSWLPLSLIAWIITYFLEKLRNENTK
ncbi:MAG: branched-chain amino acid transport system II carrier protein [Capnocytophaga sp.]|nr:branched-chain amino acid transport system II carrier protein [Capnocytophaga sp.]